MGTRTSRDRAGPSPQLGGEAQLATNFSKVAECAYVRFGSKPYWIPQLVDGVDICALKMGESWHLVRESEIASLTEDNLAFLKNTLIGADTGDLWGTFYFSLNVYVRGEDGTLKVGTLEPGQSPRVWELGLTEDQRKVAGQGATASVRCVRKTIAL
jgi:hypothetical protein